MSSFRCPKIDPDSYIDWFLEVNHGKQRITTKIARSTENGVVLLNENGKEVRSGKYTCLEKFYRSDDHGEKNEVNVEVCKISIEVSKFSCKATSIYVHLKVKSEPNCIWDRMELLHRTSSRFPLIPKVIFDNKEECATSAEFKGHIDTDQNQEYSTFSAYVFARSGNCSIDFE